jgi:hypothetical protein
MPNKASSLRAQYGVCGEWIKGRERSARGFKLISLRNLAPATQARVNPWALAQMETAHPAINRNDDQSLSIIARAQGSRPVNIAHFWKCAECPAQLSAPKRGPKASLPPFRGLPCRNLPLGVRLS